jgi:HMGL-like
MTSTLKGRKVQLHDMCLRDGMHAKREQISVEQMVKVATALDDAGIPLIQVTHGAGMGGNSLQHGFAPMTAARAACTWPPIAPRPTPRPSTSPLRASWG